MALQPGQVLNRRYRIDTQIGQGSLGAVYAGWDLNLNTASVVKEQRDVSPEATRKFTRQARALANLRHPGLPYVIDHFSLPEQGQYLVMEFINGQDLQVMLVQSGQGIAEERAIPWLFQVGEALTYLHTQPTPLFHRDVKPANIRVTPQGKVVLVDYGIGLASDPDYAVTSVGSAAYNTTALVVGNPYTAPEQFAGYSDARSDLYSLAASFYAALTAHPPRDSRARQAGQPLPGLRQLNPAISPVVESAILQAMHPDPGQRFQTVKAFQAALAGYNRPAAPVPRPPVAATMKAPYWPEQADRPARNAMPGAAGGAASFDAPIPYPSLVDNRSGSAVPEEPRQTGRLIGIAAGVLLLACLLLGVVGGGAYLLFGGGTGLPLDAARAVAATLTAEASRQALAAQPTIPVAPATASPSATFTLPPALPLAPSHTPTPTPSLTPTSTATPTATETATPTKKAEWQPCPDTYPSRLNVGDTAMVNLEPPLPNRVRSQPTTTSTVLGFIQPGENVRVIGGPVCSNEWIWWQVSSLSTGLTGWTAEGDRQGYWLAPIH